MSVSRRELINRFLPFMEWLPRVNADTARNDFIAGLTGAVVVLPQGVAFALIAGMPPEYGLYAAMVPAIVAALFGSSWHLVSGPTTAASVVLASSLSALAEPQTAQYVALAMTLTFMVGLIELTMGFAKLGALVNFISHSVVIGFTAGAAIIIAAKQLKNFLGMEVPRGLHPYEIVAYIGKHIDEANLYIAAAALVTLVTGILVRKFFPKLPYMIVAMLVGSVFAIVLERYVGADTTHIKWVGALPASLPPLSHPTLTMEQIKELAPLAVAMTLFALTEAVSIARSLAARSGQHLNGNQEFIGQGMSNMVGSFFSAYVATGSFNRSAVNYEAGARTPLAAMFAGLLLMAIVPFVAPYAKYLPYAAMAGILMLVAWGLIDFHHIKKTIKASRSEGAVLITTFLATQFLELEFAILLGVLLSLVMYLMRTSKPRILSRVPDPDDPKRKFVTVGKGRPECPQLKIIRIDGSLFFGAIAHVAEVLARYKKRHPEQKHLAIVGKGINFIDVAGAEFLVQEANARRRDGGGLYFIDMKEGACESLKRGHFLEEIGDENIFRSKTRALREIYRRLDRDICKRCDRRIFRECQEDPELQGTAGAEETSAGEATPAKA